MKTDISLVLTNYNYGEYLYETLQVVAKQTVQPDEILIVDDCSTDHSREIIQQLAAENPLIRPVLNETNLGCAASVNLGLKLAKGNYVAALGIDDPFCTTDFFAKILPFLKTQPNAGFYFGEAIFEYRNQGALLFSPIMVNLAPTPRFFSPHEFAKLYSERTELSIPTVPSLWPRDALLSIGGLLKKLDWLADWFSALVLSFRTGACYLPGVYQIIRYNPNSLSLSGQRDRLKNRALIATLLDTIDEPQFADVKPYFKIPAVIARHGFQLLELCATEERYANYLSLGLIKNIFAVEDREFRPDLSRFGQNPSESILREICFLMLKAGSERLRKGAQLYISQGRYTQAQALYSKAFEAAPQSKTLGTEIAELEALRAKKAPRKPEPGINTVVPSPYFSI